jgi:excisionase family DNA binding protein
MDIVRRFGMTRLTVSVHGFSGNLRKGAEDMPNAKPNGSLLKVSEVRERLALSRSTTYALLESGRIPSIAMPGLGNRSLRRVRPEDLEKFINDHAVGAQ